LEQQAVFFSTQVFALLENFAIFGCFPHSSVAIVLFLSDLAAFSVILQCY